MNDMCIYIVDDLQVNVFYAFLAMYTTSFKHAQASTGIDNLDPTKTSGPDGIIPTVIK